MKQFHIRFYENRKIYFGLSIGIIIIGIICNAIFGTQLDVQFKGGAMISYSYSGNMNATDVEKKVEDAVKRDVSVAINKNVKSADGSETLNNVTLTFAGNNELSLTDQKVLTKTLTELYPDSGMKEVKSNSVNPSMGQSFFQKCIVAIIITFLLLDIYIALRFRKIGGSAAGLFAIIALLHDVTMVYFTFIIFRIPLNDNFIAVVLTILGYSLNDTIVIYDRIRENRRVMGLKAGYAALVDTSINQTLTRSLFTAAATFSSIATVYVVGMIFSLSSVTTFALPMMVGVVTGCYSSICIAGPLYVMWENHKVKKLAESNSKTSKSRIAAESSAPTADGTVSKPSAQTAQKPAAKAASGKKKSKSHKKH